MSPTVFFSGHDGSNACFYLMTDVKLVSGMLVFSSRGTNQCEIPLQFSLIQLNIQSRVCGEEFTSAFHFTFP